MVSTGFKQISQITKQFTHDEKTFIFSSTREKFDFTLSNSFFRETFTWNFLRWRILTAKIENEIQFDISRGIKKKVVILPFCPKPMVLSFNLEPVFIGGQAITKKIPLVGTRILTKTFLPHCFFNSGSWMPYSCVSCKQAFLSKMFVVCNFLVYFGTAKWTRLYVTPDFKLISNYLANHKSTFRPR
jgi:hypothetical protein